MGMINYEKVELFYQDDTTPLHAACRLGNESIAKDLLDHGSDQNILNKVSDMCENSFIIREEKAL